MPIKFTIHPGKQMIVTRGEGKLSADDLFTYYKSLREHPDFDGRHNELFDLTGADGTSISSDSLKNFSSMTSTFTSKGEPIKVAVVAPSDLEFALARMYELLQSANAIRVFRDRDEAEAWLGVDLD